MNTIRIGINGFGRIGRQLTKLLLGSKNFGAYLWSIFFASIRSSAMITFKSYIETAFSELNLNIIFRILAYFL